jgi:hypothetical protein
MSNSAKDLSAEYSVSRGAKDLESCRANFLYPCLGFSQLFFSFLIFLLLFAQYGGAIINYGILTVEHCNFTGNYAKAVCIIASAHRK